MKKTIFLMLIVSILMFITSCYTTECRLTELPNYESKISFPNQKPEKLFDLFREYLAVNYSGGTANISTIIDKQANKIIYRMTFPVQFSNGGFSKSQADISCSVILNFSDSECSYKITTFSMEYMYESKYGAHKVLGNLKEIETPTNWYLLQSAWEEIKCKTDQYIKTFISELQKLK